ncbi:MAG: glycosyl transferase [Allorhizobium sp.]
MKSPLQAAILEYKAGRLDQALVAVERGLKSAAGPLRGQLLALLANIQLKRGDKRASAAAFAAAAALPSDKSALFFKYAIELSFAIGDLDVIAAIGLRAARLNPDDRLLAFRVATALKSAGRLLEAEPFIARLDSGDRQHLVLMFEFLHLLVADERRTAFLRTVAETYPDNAFFANIFYSDARRHCDFASNAAFEARVAGDPQASPACDLLRFELALFRLARSDDESHNRLPSYDTFAHGLSDQPPVTIARQKPGPAGERIRIGYLSSDFYHHATMHLFAEALAAHDRERFEITLFCYSPTEKVIHQQSWPQFLRDEIVDVRDMSSQAVAEAIAAKGIDILVDLKGFTEGGRPEIVNLSNAPVKAAYLGFPGSMSGIDIDYAITDRTVTPDSSIVHYREKLCRLPETYQANGGVRRVLPAAASRAAYGLADDVFLFAAFNAEYKITAHAVGLWAKILRAVPHACLWLFCPESVTRNNLAAAFAGEGVASERIIFAGRVAYDAHIARLTVADLALDTFPYNGHTTTSDMLWAGLPVLTVKGHSFAARVSQSLLQAIDLPELVADDDEEFCRRAVELAGDPGRLALLQQRLAANRLTAPLFDSERFARHLECAYELMIDRARAGLAPHLIDVPGMPARDGPFRIAAEAL